LCHAGLVAAPTELLAVEEELDTGSLVKHVVGAELGSAHGTGSRGSWR
jgi:hypothetical protein